MLNNRISRRSFTEAVTIQRASAGAFNEYGEHTGVGYTTITTKAVTEPISAADSENIEVLPEGLRIADARRFWLDDGVVLDDWIEYAGEKYKVFSIEKHRDHIEIIAAIQNITPDPAPEV